MNVAFLCLGGNLGKRMDNLRAAIQLLQEKAGTLADCSSVVESEPWEQRSEHLYLNVVIKLLTTHSAEELLDSCLAIEKELGRQRTADEGYSDRTVDIDIIFFNSEVMKDQLLQIPHPRYTQRKFVLMPLTEMAPDFIDPILQVPVAKLLRQCTDPCEVRYFGKL